jgi:hypothetical protein
MAIEIRLEGLEHSEDLREHALVLVQAHLGRYAADVSLIRIVFARRTGGTAPTEVRFEITASGPRLRSTTVDHRGFSPFPALTLAVARTARVIRHELGRVRARARLQPFQ